MSHQTDSIIVVELSQNKQSQRARIANNISLKNYIHNVHIELKNPLILRVIQKLKVYARHNPKRKLFVVFLVWVVIRYVFWKMYNRFRGYPNGPLGLPFLGCLLSFGSDPLEFVTNTASSPTIRCFSPTTCLSLIRPDVARQLFQSAKLVDNTPMTHSTMPELAAVNGTFVLHKVQQTIREYIKPLIDAKYVQTCNLWFPHDCMAHIGLNNVFSAVFGVQFPLNDPFAAKVSQYVEEYNATTFQYLLIEQMTNINAKYLVPQWLRWLISQKKHHRVCCFVQQWMNENGFVVDMQTNIFRRSKPEGMDSNLYGDELIQAVNTQQMTAKKAVADIVFIFLAADDTTSNTSEYILILLAKYPKIQQMVYDELQSVLQRNNLKTFDFRVLTELHIFRAFIHEGLRISSVVPLGGNPRCLTRDVEIKVDGKQYVIPKKTLLCPNRHYVHRYLDWKNNNQAMTEKNDEFHLEYWLQDGKFRMNDNFQLFGVGRRDCAGRALAMRALYAIFGLLMSKYKFVAANNDPDSIQFKVKLGFIAKIDPPIGIQVEKRT